MDISVLDKVLALATHLGFALVTMTLWLSKIIYMVSMKMCYSISNLK